MSNTQIYGSTTCSNYTDGSIRGDAWVIVPVEDKGIIASAANAVLKFVITAWESLTKQNYEYEVIESTVDGRRVDKFGHSTVTIKGKMAYIDTPIYSSTVKIKSSMIVDDDGMLANLYKASTRWGAIEIAIYEGGESCKIKSPAGEFELYRA